MSTATQLTVGESKTFQGDLEHFGRLLSDREPFTFSKYADGEWKILTGKPIDTRGRWNGEFKFHPRDEDDAKKAEDLLKSFQHQEYNYFVGVGCPCCMGQSAFEQMRDLSGQDAWHLTWANLLVNGNYAYYRAEILPLFRGYDEVAIVCNNKADTGQLPFRVDAVYQIGTNAWSEDYALSLTLPRFSMVPSTRRKLVLFCAGPLGNLLAWRMNLANPENTYLDVGSTLDPWLFPGKRGLTRRYLRGEGTSRKICTWG